jgi:hypothetical protein
VTAQLCPKCQGQGVVSRPPWIPADVQAWNGPLITYTCNLCGGRMVIDAEVVLSGISESTPSRLTPSPGTTAGPDSRGAV